MAESSENAPLALSPEALKALEARKQQLDADIEAGRLKPGERRYVTLPNGDRFQLGHPDLAEESAPRRPWWARLFGRRRESD